MPVRYSFVPTPPCITMIFYFLACAYIKDIVKLETLSDDEHIVLVYLASRVMRLSLKDSLPFLLAVQRNMKVGSQIWFYFVDKLHFYY